MAEVFHHGVLVQEIDVGPRPIRIVRSSVIGIVGTAPDADPVEFPLNIPVLIAGSRLKAAGLDTVGDRRGTLPDAMDAIFDQIGAVVVVIRVAEGVDNAATISNVIGGVDVGGSGNLTGVHALTGAESTVGVRPRILIAPGFTHQRPSGLANPVVAELLNIAANMRAIIFADGPNTNDADAITYRGDWGSDRIVVLDPWVTTFGTAANGPVDMPASAHVAGVQAKLDNDRGYWWSFSNKEIGGVIGLARPIDFGLNNPNSRANLLNEQEVATIVRSEGFRTWGNRTTSSDAKFAFLSTRRIFDIVLDSIAQGLLFAVDRPSQFVISEVLETINAFVRSQIQAGALIGGRVYADDDLNTPTAIADGKLYFNVDLTPTYPAENIIIKAALVNDFLTEVTA